MTERIARWWSSTLPNPALIIGLATCLLASLLGWSLAYGLAYEMKWQNWLAFAALVMVALLPAVVRWPVVSTFGLYAFLATSLDALPLLPGVGTVAKPFGAVAGAVLLGAGLIERRLGRPPAAALWWGAFMLWATLTTMWAVDSEAALTQMPKALSLVVLYLVAVCFRPSRRELYWVCTLTVLGGALAAALAYFFGVNAELASGNAARARLMLNNMDSNPNTLGRMLLLPLTLAIASFVGERGMLQRTLAVGCAVFIGLGTFLSMSRGAVVAMVVMLLVLLYRMRVRWHIVGTMVLLLVVATLMPDAFYKRFEDTSGGGRLEIWQTGLRMLERSGFLGAGLEGFHLLYGAYVPGDRSGSHNTFLATLVDLGVPGLAMMLAAIGSGLLAVWRTRSAGGGSILLSALEAACIGTLMSGMFADILWTKTFWLPWILLTWAMHPEKRSGETTDALVPRDPLRLRG